MLMGVSYPNMVNEVTKSMYYVRDQLLSTHVDELRWRRCVTHNPFLGLGSGSSYDEKNKNNRIDSQADQDLLVFRARVRVNFLL